MEFNKLTKEPVEGFNISLKNEDFYNWNVVQHNWKMIRKLEFV